MLASLLLHAAVVGLLAWMGGAEGATGVTNADLAIEDEDRLDLGIQQSNAVTMTWIGFETPTKHEAPQSEIDQAQLNRAMASGATVAPENPPAPGEQGTPQDNAAARPVGDWSDLAPQVSMALNTSQVRELLQEMLEQAMLAASANSSAVAEAGGDQQAEGESGPQEESAEENADRESDAASRRRPVNVEPGKPVAAQGLEIKTARPNWTGFMRATLRPRNPKLDITFGPDGKAKLVRFVVEDGKRQSTGSSDADDVLVNAMYRWTATGVAIDELDASDPEAGVTITMRILLR